MDGLIAFTRRTPAAPRGRILCLAAIALCVFSSGSARLFAAEGVSPSSECSTFRVREQDQVWLVSTRHLSCGLGYVPTFQVCRYERGFWQPSSEAEFFALDSPNVVTPIYVHGNRIDAGLAGSYGLSVYFEMAGKLDHEPPVRFVIWSWPADQIRGPINDVRSKAARSDYEAYYLGWFLSRMQPDVRVGVVGFSFGARIVSGAMHLLDGASIFGYSLPSDARPQLHVALWAAAEHSHWFLPGQFHGQALAAADAWYITIDCCDPVLARYRFLDKCDNPTALGYAGIYGRNLLPPDVNARIEEVNVSNIIGGDHDWRPYLYSRYIQDRTRDYVLWHQLAGNEISRAAAEVAKN